uniref:3-hydroxyisobutyrate dehydrogenase n=1 Tax=Heterorhabditis bacteriophora TaxID=37862 RepID=A0A1I7XR07_HETBA
MSTVGFIGLGNMGAHMARNLMRSGHKLIVFDLNTNIATQFKADGAEIAAHPADVAAATENIITMLPSSPHVKEVYGADNGILRTMQPGTLCIDSSTIDQIVSIEIAGWCGKKSSKYIDAPVSGGVTGMFQLYTLDVFRLFLLFILLSQDLSLAQNAATTVQAPTPLGSMAHQIYRILSKHPEYSSKDFGVVYQFLKDQDGEQDNHNS